MKRLTTLLLVASAGLLAACTTDPGADPRPTSSRNLGPDACTLEGTSELELLTGGDGQELGIKEITTDDGVPPEQVLVEVGGQAAMSVTDWFHGGAPGVSPN